MFNVGPWELVLILVIVLLIFGPGKLPEVGKYLGKGIKEFKKSMNALETDIMEEPAKKPAAEQNQEKKTRRLIAETWIYCAAARSGSVKSGQLFHCSS